jgi:spore maturation protein A
MLNYVWFFLIVAGFIFGAANGKLDQVTKAAIDSANGAVTLCIGLAGVMCLWVGIMKIAEKSGLTDKIAKVTMPLVTLLFPEIKGKQNAVSAVVMNLTANFMGMGNAATPLGIKAIKELDYLNNEKTKATNSMCMLIVLNTSMIQLVPATLIALRSSAGSINPSDVMGPIWIASLFTTIAGILMVKILQKRWV